MTVVVMELYGGREEIERLHCGLHSDYIVRRESLLVTSAVNQVLDGRVIQTHVKIDAM